jgi:hypothetical protein
MAPLGCVDLMRKELKLVVPVPLVGQESIYAFLLVFTRLGWETGFEPATFGATDRRSTS